MRRQNQTLKEEFRQRVKTQNTCRIIGRSPNDIHELENVCQNFRMKACLLVAHEQAERLVMRRSVLEDHHRSSYQLRDSFTPPYFSAN